MVLYEVMKFCNLGDQSKFEISNLNGHWINTNNAPLLGFLVPNNGPIHGILDFLMDYWVAVRRTYVFTLQEVEKNLPDIAKSRDTIWTIRSRTASCFKPQVAIFQLRSSYKLHKGYT